MQPMILTLEHVSKNYNDNTAVYDISFTVEPGSIVAIRGQTGSGKTTLLRLVAGLTAPSLGSIRLGDMPVLSGSKSHLRHMGLLLKEQGLYQRLTVQEYLDYFRKLYQVDKTRVDEVIRQAGLMDRRNSSLRKLSESLSARVRFARSLLHQPSLLLLDEPTSHLDLETMEILRKMIVAAAEAGTAVLFTTTSQEEAQSLACRTGRLNRGRVESWEGNGEAEALSEDGNPSSIAMERRMKIEKIPAKINDRIILFNPMELTYIESQDGVSVLHTGSEQFPCPLTLSELEEKLKPFGFFRSHRSYIVNLQRVREVIPWTRNSYSLVLDDTHKSSIPLSKNSLKELEGFLDM